MSKPKQLTIYWPYIVAAVLVILANGAAYVIDSDSGQEYGRAFRILHGMPYDNGPILTGALYGMFEALGSPVLFVTVYQILLGCLLFVILKKTYYEGLPALQFLLLIALVVFSSIGLRLLTYPVPYLLMVVLLLFHLFFAIRYLRSNALTDALFAAFFLAGTYYAKNHSMVFVPGFFFLALTIYWNNLKTFLRTTAIFYALALAFVLPGLLTNILHSGSRFWHYPNSWYTTKYNPVAYYDFWNYPKLFSQEYYLQHFNNFSTYGFALIILLVFALALGRYSKMTLELRSIVVYFGLSLLPIVISKVPPTYQYLYAVYLFAVLLVTAVPYRIEHETQAILLIVLLVLAGIGAGFYSAVEREYFENGRKAAELQTIDEMTENQYAILSRSENVRPYLANNVITLPQLEEDTAIDVLTGKLCAANVSSVKYVLEDKSLPMSRFFSVWSPEPVDILGPCEATRIHNGRHYIVYEVTNVAR